MAALASKNKILVLLARISSTERAISWRMTESLSSAVGRCSAMSSFSFCFWIGFLISLASVHKGSMVLEIGILIPAGIGFAVTEVRIGRCN
jgi:hypothetical protein